MNIRNQSKKFAILTHDDFDGFACGALMRHYLRTEINATEIETFHVQYGGNVPEELKDISEKNIIILDFSYDYETTKTLFEKSAGFFMLDHHDIDPRINDIIGTYLFKGGSAVGHLHDLLYGVGSSRSRLTVFADDYDSWTHNLPGSKYINYVLVTNKKGRDVELMDNLYTNNFLLENMIDAGEKFIQAVHEKCAYLFKNKNKYNTFNIDGVDTVWINNSDTDNRSIYAEQIMKYLEVKTAVVYCIFHDGVLFNVRSIEGGLDAGEFARQHGGGGREQTAAFKLPLKEGLYFIAHVNGLSL